MPKAQAIVIIGPMLWNQLPPSTRSTSLPGEPSASFSFPRHCHIFLWSLELKALLIDSIILDISIAPLESPILLGVVSDTARIV